MSLGVVRRDALDRVQTDCTGELKQKRLPDGSLRLRFGKAYGI
jgi:hypothetical protein